MSGRSIAAVERDTGNLAVLRPGGLEHAAHQRDPIDDERLALDRLVQAIRPVARLKPEEGEVRSESFCLSRVSGEPPGEATPNLQKRRWRVGFGGDEARPPTFWEGDEPARREPERPEAGARPLDRLRDRREFTGSTIADEKQREVDLLGVRVAPGTERQPAHGTTKHADGLIRRIDGDEQSRSRFVAAHDPMVPMSSRR